MYDFILFIWSKSGRGYLTFKFFMTKDDFDASFILATLTSTKKYKKIDIKYEIIYDSAREMAHIHVLQNHSL